MAILTIFSKQTLYVLRRLHKTFEIKRVELSLNTDVYRVFFLNFQSTFNTIVYRCRAASRAGVIVGRCQTRAVLYSAINRGFGRIEALTKRC
jgi:hypothetical protein